MGGINMGYIYKITNKINNKIYIGQTVKSVKVRFQQHLSTAKNNKSNCLHRGYALHNALLKYGAENFQVETLGEYPDEELDAVEISIIKELGSLAPAGYNITAGGGGIRGVKFTDEQRAKCSEALRRRWATMTEEEVNAYRERCSKMHKGVPKSKEHRAKISEWAKTRTGEKNPFYGKTHSPEFKQYIRELNLGNTYKQGIKVQCEKDGELHKFNSYSDASYWLIDNGYTKSKNRTSVTTTIKESISTKKKRYGFIWSIIE